MTLKRLIVRGYKSIRDANLEFGDVTVLIGANGAGKSNLVSAFRLLNEIIEEQCQKFVTLSGGANSLLYLGAKTTDKLMLCADWGSNSYVVWLKPTANDALFFDFEQVSYHNEVYESPTYFPLATGGLETGLLIEVEKNPDKVASYVLTEMKQWKVYHFHDTSDTAPMKMRGAINDNLYFRSDASNLAAFLYSLQETAAVNYKAICDTIRLVAPFFKSFLLRPYLDTDSIQLEWFEHSNDFPFKAYHLSDGTLRFICLATLLLQPNLPKVIVMDEPELGLHPYAIAVLASLIKSASERCQIILSTQSVELLNEFAPEEVLVVEKKGSESTFKRQSTEELSQWLESYTLGELWQKNVLGGRPS